MDEEELQMRQHIEAYLQESKPIHWANWYARCPDPEAKKYLESVLFRDGGLRDMTDSAVRLEVLDAIYQTPAAMELVIADLADEIAKLERDDHVA